MAMVNNNKGLTFIELMISIGILGIGVVAFINMSKIDTKGTGQVIAQDAKAYVTKEILTALESKANCESLLKNKAVGANLSLLSTDGVNLTAGTIIDKKNKIIEFKYKFLTTPNLPSSFKLINIYFTIAPVSQPSKIVTQNVRIIGNATSLVSSCISPREDGGLLIQKKAIDLAKSKVCTEDLKGTMQASGKCTWPEPVTYNYVTIQL